MSVRTGVDFAGTPIWGYNDNSLDAYLGFGGLCILFGAAVFFVAVLLIQSAVRGLARAPGRRWRRREFLAAFGLTLGLLAITAVGWGVAANLVSPSETSDPEFVENTTLVTAVAAVFLGFTSAMVLKASLKNG
ncbi:MAG: hypothetical protein WBW62_12960 [Solirubrobacterales bacterium]